MNNNVALHSKDQKNGYSIWRAQGVKIYGWLLIGFLICHYLVSDILPALGLGFISDQYGSAINAYGPYLILPINFQIIVLAFDRDKLGGWLATIGTLIMSFFFYINYQEPLSFIGLGIVGLGIFIAVLRNNQPLSHKAFIAIKYYHVYLAASVIAVGLRFFITGNDLDAPGGYDVANIPGVLPVIVLAAYYYFRKTNNQPKA